MEIPADTTNDVTKRLRMVEGQGRGIQQMLPEDPERSRAQRHDLSEVQKMFTKLA